MAKEGVSFNNAQITLAKKVTQSASNCLYLYQIHILRIIFRCDIEAQFTNRLGFLRSMGHEHTLTVLFT